MDTNILVYAHRRDSTWHAAARRQITRLAEGQALWAIPWPCIHEFLAIVSHQRIYAPPTPIESAITQVEVWASAPNLALLSESESYWAQLRALLKAARISGPQLHDARVMAICMDHGVTELWTADRDFSRFSGIKTRNPLIETPT